MSAQPNSGTAADNADSERRVFVNRIPELRRASAWVRGFAVERGLARELVHALELSVNEAFSNIINYAYCDSAQHEVTIELTAAPDHMRIQVEDDGEPFDPLKLPIEELPQSLERSRPTGRGVPLMFNMMDDLHYARRDGMNVLTLVLRYVRR